ncbi:MAG: hypothetical protein AB4041_08815 [Microcystaceae cyanobacterium]
MNTSFVINQSPQPVIIGQQWIDLIPLSYADKSTANYLFLSHLKQLPPLKNYSYVYVLTPSQTLRNTLQSKGFKLEKTTKDPLWKIFKNE